MRVGILYSRVRAEEKLLFEAFSQRSAAFDLLDDRKLIFDIAGGETSATRYDQYDVIIERCINHGRALNSLRILNDRQIPTVNSAQVVDICGDKLQTTSALTAAGIPSPRTMVAFTAESALEAIEELGYPVVMKPSAPVPGAGCSARSTTARPRKPFWNIRRCWEPTITASFTSRSISTSRGVTSAPSLSAARRSAPSTGTLPTGSQTPPAVVRRRSVQ